MTLKNSLKPIPEHGPCFICGSENPHNVGLRWYIDEEGVVTSEFTLRLRSSTSLHFAQDRR